MSLVIDVNGLSNQLGDTWVHRDLDFHVNRGEIVAIVGGSGSGKTTLLRTLLMLQQPTAGQIRLLGTDINHCSMRQANTLKKQLGVLFQQSALFSSLTVLENVQFPLLELTKLGKRRSRELALLKIILAGLPIEAGKKYPSELSGGMLKRAALARALAFDPKLLFLDEPTSGLDPHSSVEFDSLIRKLRDSLGLTIVMVSHDLASLERATDRVAFIGRQKVLAFLPLAQLREQADPLIQDYFSGTS